MCLLQCRFGAVFGVLGRCVDRHQRQLFCVGIPSVAETGSSRAGARGLVPHAGLMQPLPSSYFDPPRMFHPLSAYIINENSHAQCHLRLIISLSFLSSRLSSPRVINVRRGTPTMLECRFKKTTHHIIIPLARSSGTRRGRGGGGVYYQAANAEARTTPCRVTTAQTSLRRREREPPPLKAAPLSR